MASYRPITLPDVAALRSYVLSALARGGATVYQRADGSHVIVRADDAPWPPYSAPADAPADLAAAGWVEVL